MRRSLTARVEAALGGLPATFWTLWWGLLVNRVGSFVVAFLAIYLVRERGFTPGDAGSVLALYGLGLIVAGPVGGLLADRVGRRATMLLGLVLGAVSVAALAVASHPALLAALAFLSAAGGELYRPAMTAAVADVVPPRDRARAYGLVYWTVNLGLAIGLVLGGLVAERSLAALFLTDAATSLVFAAIIWLRVPESRPTEGAHAPALAGLWRVFSDRAYLSFLGLHLVGLVVFTQWQLALPVDMQAHGLGPSSYAYLMAVNCAGVVVLQPVLSPRLAGQDPARLLAVSTLLFGAGFGLNALGGSWPVYAVGTTLWTVGEVVGFPVASTLVADLAPSSLRGRYQGVFAMTWGLALTLSPLVAGRMLELAGPRALWLACLGLAVVAAAGNLALAGPLRRRRAEVAAG